MTDHFVTVGDDLALPQGVKVLAQHLPASGVPKAMVGLDKVDNTTDAAKRVSTAQQAALDGKVDRGVAALQKVGDGADPNASTTQNVKLLVTANRTNPDKVIEQHLVGYSFYSGTPQVSVGTLQGGSCESYVFANGSADWGTVLGFEGVGRGDGDNAARKIAAVIGNQGTSIAKGAVNVDLLVSLRARGPVSSSGATGTVTESRSLDIQEPLTGTVRRALYGIGTHRFRKGTTSNQIEVANSAEVLKWTFSDALVKGYASDGSSVRVTLDTSDTPASARFGSELFGSSKHISFKNNSAEVFSVAADGTLEITSAGAGVVLKSPNGTRYRLTVGDDGALTTTAL